MQRTMVVLLFGMALMLGQSCGRGLAHCTDPGGCKLPLTCHEPTGLCVRPDPPDAGDGASACRAFCAGCCDTDGKCQGGSSSLACGTGGLACAVCGANQTCVSASCSLIGGGSGGGTGGGTGGGSGGGAGGPDYEWTLWHVSPEAPPASNYTASAGIVTDSVTGLQWQQVVSTDTYDWPHAKDYCTKLPLGGSGWRLPTLIELESIVNYGPHYAPAIDTAAFPNTASNYFWSSSLGANGTSGAWAVNFNGGTTHPDGMSARVRCVR